MMINSTKNQKQPIFTVYCVCMCTDNDAIYRGSKYTMSTIAIVVCCFFFFVSRYFSFVRFAKPSFPSPSILPLSIHTHHRLRAYMEYIQHDFYFHIHCITLKSLLCSIPIHCFSVSDTPLRHIRLCV